MIVEGDAAGLLLVGGRRRSTPRDRPTRNCVGGEGTRVDRVHPPADGSIASYVDGWVSALLRVGWVRGCRPAGQVVGQSRDIHRPCLGGFEQCRQDPTLAVG